MVHCLVRFFSIAACISILLEPSAFTRVTGADISRAICLAKKADNISCCLLVPFRAVREITSQCARQYLSTSDVSLPATSYW